MPVGLRAHVRAANEEKQNMQRKEEMDKAIRKRKTSRVRHIKSGIYHLRCEWCWAQFAGVHQQGVYSRAVHVFPPPVHRS